jgi:hypothetical protein
MKERYQLVRMGFFLSVFTVAWNVLEGLIAILSSYFSGSVALFGFGVDSFIESTSGVIIGWRFYYELRGRQQEDIEKAEILAAKLAGSLLLILALGTEYCGHHPHRNLSSDNARSGSSQAQNRQKTGKQSVACRCL